MFKNVLSAVFDLGFFPNAGQPEERLLLGRRQLTAAQLSWDIICWIFLALGIFLRQGLEVQALSWHRERLSAASFAASLVISFALFPLVMRHLNRRRPRPNLIHLATPFAFGFFLDLARFSAYKWFKA